MNHIGNNPIPLYPQIPPPKLYIVAYLNCRRWLEGELWQEELPKRSPPQRGSEAVRVLGATLDPQQRQAFIDGWNTALDEWEADRIRRLNHLKFKAGCWGTAFMLSAVYWWMLAGWWL